METIPKDTIDMEKNVNYMPLSPAIGNIQASQEQAERLDEVTERVGSGEFHRETEGKIPCKCIDGRCSNLTNLLPNSAGGTETLMVADDLTTKDFVLGGDESTGGQYSAMVEYLKETRNPIGGHTAEDLHGAPSGCGANDKLSEIYDFIAKNGEVLRGLAAELGVKVDEETQQLITGNAAARSEFSDGAALLKTLKDKGGDESVDVLKGAHKEVVAVINKRAGTTLDRNAFEAEFGEGYQAFNVDTWAFAEGARLITQMGDDQEQLKKQIAQKQAAMVYYNLATACVLCGPNMRVVVLE